MRELCRARGVGGVRGVRLSVRVGAPGAGSRSIPGVGETEVRACPAAAAVVVTEHE